MSEVMPSRRCRYRAIFELCMMFNVLPLFNLSVDENFGTMNKSGSIRFSLFCLFFGNRIFYFITMRGGEWSFFKCLSLVDVLPHYNQLAWRRDGDKFDNFNVDVELHYSLYKDFLQREIADLDHSMLVVDGKVNTYLTVLSISIGFFLLSIKSIFEVIGDQEYFIYQFFLIFLASFLCMHLVGIGFLVSYYLSVKTYLRSSFKDFHSDPCQLNAIKIYYQTYKAKMEYARHQTSVVLNIQSYFRKCIFSAIFLFAMTGVSWKM